MSKIHRLLSVMIIIVGSIPGSAGLASAQGQGEINQALIDASGGFPFVIDTPGSYILTSNISKPASAGSGDALRIDSSDVTLDLRGFTVSGEVACFRDSASCAVTCAGGAPGVGINLRPGNQRITVENGAVHGFFTGLNSSAMDVVIDDMSVSDNAFNGISATGQNSSVSHVYSYRNGDNGVVIGNGSTVTDSSLAFNDAAGVLADPNGTIARNAIYSNRTSGIQTGPGTIFMQNAITGNCANPPVVGGVNGGQNGCTNASGAAVSCQ